MNDIPDPNAAPADEASDPALDVLLDEAMGGPRPPDLKREILSQLRETTQLPAPQAPPVVRGNRPKVESDALRYALMTFAVAVSIAIIAILVQRQRGVEIGRPDSSEIAESKSIAPSSSPTMIPRSSIGPDARSLANDMPASRPSGKATEAADAPADRTSSVDAASSIATNDLKPRTLSTSDDDPQPGPSIASDRIGLAELLKSRVPMQFDLRDGMQVSSDIESTLVNYWTSVGVSVTPSISDVELSAAMRQRLGVLFNPAQMRDLPLVRRQITIPANAKELSRRFLQHLTNQSLGQVSDDQHGTLRRLAADCFEGGSRLDVQISDLVTGDHPASSQWYSGMSHGGRHGLVQRIASVTMNQDIRCFRCHDGYIDARGKQSDYWSFAGMLFQSLHHRAGSGRWEVIPPVGSSEDSDGVSKRPIAAAGDVFYDAVDGRRVAVDPGVPVGWLDPATGLTESVEADARAIAEATLATWGPSLRGSRALAGGLVNVIWRMVHDRPLTQSVADVNAAPRDEKLMELHAILADDLVASNFDIARTLALVITSPVTRRSIADPYKVESAGQVVDSETEQAYMAFAAAKPIFKRRPIDERLETILTTSGATLNVLKDEGMLLAQPIGADGAPATLNTPKRRPNTGKRIEIQDFPIVRSDLPVAWLSSIEDPQSRLGHVCFMAGRTAIPEVVRQANAAMVAAGIDESLRLSRIWWMIRP